MNPRILDPLNPKRNIDPARIQTDIIAAATCMVAGGGVVVFPTTGLYGLGADAFNPAAVERVFAIKQRQAQKPLLVLIKAPQELPRLVKRIPPAAERLMQAFWPGHLTLVFQARDDLPPNLTAGSGKIGVRLPLHPVATALVQALSTPLTGTSANISDEDACADIAALDPIIADQVDLILDAGPLKGGPGSTIVDVTTDPVQVLRQGAISTNDIFTVLNE